MLSSVRCSDEWLLTPVIKTTLNRKMDFLNYGKRTVRSSDRISQTYIYQGTRVGGSLENNVHDIPEAMQQEKREHPVGIYF